MRKVQQIDGLVIDEISLVDKGANQHATVTIAKSADGEKEKQMEIFDEQGNPLDPEQLSDGDHVFDVNGVEYEYTLDDEPAGEVEQEQELVSVGKSADENPFRQNAPVKVSKSSGLSDELREELSKALTDRDRDEVVSKALTHMAKLEEIAKAAQKAADEERQVRLTTEYTEIAKSYALPVPDQALGQALLHAAEALSTQDCEVIAKALRAGSERVFEEQGHNGGGTNSDVITAAEAVIKNAGGDRAEAMAEFFDKNPAAYDEYLAENQRG